MRSRESNRIITELVERDPQIAGSICFVLVALDILGSRYLDLILGVVLAGEEGVGVRDLRILAGLNVLSFDCALEKLAAEGLIENSETVRKVVTKNLFFRLPLLYLSEDVRFKDKNTKKLKEKALTAVRMRARKRNKTPQTSPANVRKGNKKPLEIRLLKPVSVENEKKQYQSNRLKSNNNPKADHGSKCFPKCEKKATKKQSNSQVKKRSNARKNFQEKLADHQKNRSRKSTDPVKRYSDTPSQYPTLRAWTRKKNPNRWLEHEWVGYWLWKWVETYGLEDATFTGQTFHRQRTAKPNIYWEKAFAIRNFLGSDRGCRGSGEQLKKYIDWLFDDLARESWLNNPISVESVFKITNNRTFVMFRNSKVKPLKKSKKKKSGGKRYRWGYVYDE
jgi:hypothetical protein